MKYSIAASDGEVTKSRPPKPGKYGYATQFHRVHLENFQRFPEPIPVKTVFQEKESELRGYFSRNAARSSRLKRHIFYAFPKGRLRCLMGAYLSEVDEELATILFGSDFNLKSTEPRRRYVDVRTGDCLRTLSARIGQREFSKNVRSCYGSRCCFPDCDIVEYGFLIGSHIARWTDNKEMRGKVENGLCLCLMHDRAFERGLFTVGSDFKVRINEGLATKSVWAKKNLYPFEGKKISLGDVAPSAEALREHWDRIGIVPTRKEEDK